MSLLSLSRIITLRAELEEECIDMEGIIDINAAFLQIPEDELPEPRENAMAADQLNELEDRVTPLERSIYNFILENFGESEANDPCFDLGEIANHLESNFKVIEKGGDPDEIAFVWGVQDVMSIEPRSGELKDALTAEEAREVLHNFNEYHDGSQQAMWEDLQLNVDWYKEKSDKFNEDGTRK
jgi:hypothetical protein